MTARYACLVAALAISIALASAQTPLTLEKTISLPGVHGRIDHMAYDTQRARLFVAALGSDALVVVDAKTGAVVHTITGLAEPQGIGLDPDRNQLWVANGRDGSVRIYDEQSFHLLRTVLLGDDADNVRRDPETGQMLVGYGAGGIALFDSNAAQRLNIKLDAHPESFQLEAGTSRIFVNLPNAHRIAVVDRKTGSAVASWQTDDARANFPMALDQADKRLFAVCRNPVVLLAFDTVTGRILEKLPTAGDSDDVFYDAALKRVYVSGGEGVIVVYQQADGDHYAEIARVKTISGARTSLFVPSLNRLFVAVREHGGEPAEIRVFETGK